METYPFFCFHSQLFWGIPMAYPAYPHLNSIKRPPTIREYEASAKLQRISSKDICGGCKWPKTCRHSRPQKRWFTIKEILVSAVTREQGEGGRHDKLIRHRLEKLDVCLIMLVFNGNPERHRHEPLHLIFSCLDSDFIAGCFQTTHPLKPTPGVPHMIRRCSWIHLVKRPTLQGVSTAGIRSAWRHLSFFVVDKGPLFIPLLSSIFRTIQGCVSKIGTPKLQMLSIIYTSIYIYIYTSRFIISTWLWVGSPEFWPITLTSHLHVTCPCPPHCNVLLS